MRYLYIFLGCYVLTFMVINLRMTMQRARMDAQFQSMGGSAEKLQANIREMLPLPKEIFIRLWAPFVVSILPTIFLSIAYFIFS